MAVEMLTYAALAERLKISPEAARADCNAAGLALCRAKGFQAGAGLDTQTEYCFERSRGGVGNCVFVTRAACH